MEGIISDWFENRSGARHGCTITLSLFLSPTDWILECTVHRGLAGASLRDESFSDLDYAENAALLDEMFEVLIPSLDITQEEASPFGLEINWGNTKILITVDSSVPQHVQVVAIP